MSFVLLLPTSKQQPKLNFAILILGVLGCSTALLGEEIPSYPEDLPDLYDDIRFTPEQELERQERGFSTISKWPIVNNEVPVLYYFDTHTIPYGSVTRRNFKRAVRIYGAHTCIKWVETSPDDFRHKVKVFAGKGCWSFVGRSRYSDNEISIGKGCQRIGTILHEMGHCMGLQHTQSRPDRDNYVKIWFENVKKGMEQNFEKKDGTTFNLPYDYMSMMHYGNNYFSRNGSFTVTTADPDAMFVIGTRPNTFRFTDSAFLNKGYDCDQRFAEKCPQITCQNGGYVGKNCRCKCPENTSGDRCQSVISNRLYNLPSCGGTITSEQDVVPNGYPWASTKEKCVFKIEAPECKVPAITVIEAAFYWASCGGNKLALQVSDKYFGYTFCKQHDIPFGKAIVADKRTAAIYYYTYASGFPKLGFRASVKFVDDPSCVHGKYRPPLSSTTVAAPLSSGCVFHTLGQHSFVYETVNFPSSVRGRFHCKQTRSIPDPTHLVFSKVKVNLLTAGDDTLTLSDYGIGIRYYATWKNFTSYSLWPLKIEFQSSSVNGQGFRVTYEPASGLPSPCNGETIYLEAGTTKIIRNPLENYAEKKARCAFKIEGPKDHSMRISTSNLFLSRRERLKFTPYIPIYDYYYSVGSGPEYTWGNIAKFYYIGRGEGTWELKISML